MKPRGNRPKMGWKTKRGRVHAETPEQVWMLSLLPEYPEKSWILSPLPGRP